jgi:phosphatidate phosphatase APP1
VTDWRHDLASLTGEIHKRIRGTARKLAREIGAADPVAIIPYRGFGTVGRVFVHGRVLEDEKIAAAAVTDSSWRNLINTWKRLESDPVASAQVRARIGSAERVLVSDDEGFFGGWIDLRGPLDPDLLWHAVDLELTGPAQPAPVRATGLCLVPPPDASYAVISDLDDTVIQSHVTSFLRAARTLFLDNARTRLPFPGVAAFYQALSAGTRPGTRNPIFYVSSSPWNLYGLLVEFLELQGVPEGPLMLRDWDISPATLGPGRHHDHKARIIRRLVDLYPGRAFILIGDSGQQDPEIYRAIVKEFPDRILAVYIRNVTPAPERIAAIGALAEEIRASSSTLVLADDTLAAARHAAEHGWILPASLGAIGEEKRADEGKTAGKADAPGAPTETDATPTVVIDGRKS